MSAVAEKISEERVAAIRRFLTQAGIRRETEELHHLSQFLTAFPDATLREIYIAGFGLILHIAFRDDVERAKEMLREMAETVSEGGA